MSPVARSAGTMVRRPLRFGTSCHIRWLALDMSTGFTSWKVAVYSTIPLALRGASLMSWITAFLGSLGSSSPKARPASVSYWPAVPKLAPSKAGETFFSTTILVTRAWASDARMASRLAAAMPTAGAAARRCLRDLVMCFSRTLFETELGGLALVNRRDAAHRRSHVPRSHIEPVERRLVFDVLEPVEQRLRGAAIEPLGQHHEFFLELRLGQRALRRALEARHLARELAPVLELDGDRGGEIAAVLAGGDRHLDARRHVEDGTVVHRGFVERARVDRVAIERERDAEGDAVLGEHQVARRRDVVGRRHPVVAED